MNATIDNILIHGHDGTTNHTIKTNSDGQVDIRPLTTADTVTVSAIKLDVRDMNAVTDNILIHGYDGTTNRLVRTNALGQVDIRPLTTADHLTVSAAALDIRRLTSANDAVSAVVMTSHTEVGPIAVSTADTYAGTTPQDIARWPTFSYFIENASETAAAGMAKIQISPDGTKWVDDSAEETILQNAFTVLVNTRYLRYVRIAYKSAVDGFPASLKVTFQARS